MLTSCLLDAVRLLLRLLRQAVQGGLPFGAQRRLVRRRGRRRAAGRERRQRATGVRPTAQGSGDGGAEPEDGDDGHGRGGDPGAVTPAQGLPSRAEPLRGGGEAVGSGPEAAVEQLHELEVAVVVSHATSTECPPDRLSWCADFRPVKSFADGVRHGLPSSFVDIVELDAAALADDAVMREFYDLSRRAELLGREQAPFWTFEEFIGAFRSEDSGERQQLFAAYDGDRMIAYAVLWSFLLDNTDKAFFGLDVDLPDRRRGVGRAMLARIEQVAKDDGRALVLTDTKLPFDERETHGYRQFAEACGYELSNYEVVRHLPLPVPDERIQEWIDEAAPRHEGYTIETFVDEVPDDLVESLCVLLGQLAVDAPTGAVDFDEEAMTPERYAEKVATVKAMGRARYETRRAHARPAGGRAVDARRAPGRRAPTSTSGARSSIASTAGTRSASRRRP